MAESDKFLLQWNEFQANVNQSYQELRVSGQFSDVTLASDDGHKVPCHKLILGSSSPHLASLLSSPHSSPLVIPGITSHQLQSVLDFIYHGEVEVDKEDLVVFLALGEKLQLKGLVKPGKKEERKEASDETDTEEDIHILEELDVSMDTEIEDDFTEDASNNLLLKTPTKSDEWKEKIHALIEKKGDLWRCLECGKLADQPKDRWRLKVHVEIHLGGVEHSCTLCGHNSTTSAALSQHKYKKHKDEMKTIKTGALKCNICGHNSTTNAAVTQHKYKNHKEEMKAMKTVAFKFKCSICGKGSRTSKGVIIHKYKNHKNSPKEEGKYKCRVCGKGSKTAKGRQLHKWKYHKKKTIPDEKVVDANMTESSEDNSVTIKEESLVEAKKDSLMIEIGIQIERVKKEVQMLKDQSKERNIVKEPESDLEEVNNSHVGKENESVDVSLFDVSSLDLAELHQKSVSLCAREGGMWTCTRCGKKAEDKHKHNLFRHAEVHLEGLAFPCDKCGKVSRSSHGLYQHKAKVHPNNMVERQYKCAVCGKGSKTSKGLESHRYKYHKAG